jgi:hypothetical protein
MPNEPVLTRRVVSSRIPRINLWYFKSIRFVVSCFSSLAFVFASVCVGYSVDIPTPNDRGSFRVCLNGSYSAMFFNSLSIAKIFIIHDKSHAAPIAVESDCVPMPKWVSMTAVHGLCHKYGDEYCDFVLAEGYGFPMIFASRYTEDLRPGSSLIFGTLGGILGGIDPASWLGGFPIIICWPRVVFVCLIYIVIIETVVSCVVARLRHRRSRKGLCRECGYVLENLWRCPECGSRRYVKG